MQPRRDERRSIHPDKEREEPGVLLGVEHHRSNFVSGPRSGAASPAISSATRMPGIMPSLPVSWSGRPLRHRVPSRIGQPRGGCCPAIGDPAMMLL